MKELCDQGRTNQENDLRNKKFDLRNLSQNVKEV
jgi:hypothetical protein